MKKGNIFFVLLTIIIFGNSLVSSTWFNSSWDYNKEYTNLTGNITYIFFNASINDNTDFNDTRFISCYNDSLVFNHTLEAKFETYGQFRINNLGENCSLRYYGNSEATSTSSASDVYFNPVSAYYFDTNANDFVGSNNGTPSGTSLNGSGYINDSYYFDGVNDYIDLGSALFETSGGTQPYSYFTWIKTTTTEGVLIMSQFSGGAVANRFAFGMADDTSGKLRYFKGSPTLNFYSSGTVNGGGWTHVGWTKASGGTVTFYINGLSSGGGTDTRAYENSNTFIGSGSTTFLEFIGNIDESRFYDYEVSATQAMKIYTETAPNFIEGNETVQPAADSCTYSGSGNWEIDCSDNCTITSDIDVGENNITITGYGTFTTSSNITGWDLLHIEGVDTSHMCIARCLDGGCFK